MASLAPGQAPFGVQANWGMPIVIRNEFGGAIQRPLGHPLPDWRIGVGQTVSYKKLSVYGLVEGAYDLVIGSRARAANGRVHGNGKRVSVETAGLQPELAA